MPPVSGKRAGDLGERQRAAQRDDAAGDPDEKDRQRTRQPIGDAGRRSEDSRADRDADDDGDGAPEAEPARQLAAWLTGVSDGAGVADASVASSLMPNATPACRRRASETVEVLTYGVCADAESGDLRATARTA